MRLPPGRASTFEAAGKQNCDCVAWSRKHRVGFISRQGVYESPRPSFHAGLRDKVSRTCGLTPVKIEIGGKAIFGLSRLDCPSAKTGEAVNGGTFMRRSS